MEHPEQKLAGLRARIDATDEELCRLLIARMGIIREVAALKAEHWPNNCHIRSGREGQMHAAIAKRFAGTGFPQLAALSIWRQLIGASTHLESPLTITHLDTYSEHLWLAREYFGLQIGTQTAPSLNAALAQLNAGNSTILILPMPSAAEWWKQAEVIRNAGLSIFAALPVAENILPTGARAAVALACLTPEASGDDVSYHVVDGKLIIRDGFTPNAEGLFLGAHPRPIILGATV